MILPGLFLLLGLIALPAVPVYGEEKGTAGSEIEDSLLQEMDMQAVQDSVDELLSGVHFSFSDMVHKLMSGEEGMDRKTMVKLIKTLVSDGLTGQREAILQITALVLALSLVANFSELFRGGQIAEMGFYLIYLLMFARILGDFRGISENLAVTLEGLTGLMRVLTPSYYLAIAAASGVSTAAMFYQIVLAAIWVAEKLMALVLLPLIRLYVLLAMVNHLTKEEFLSHLTELLENGIDWILKTALGMLVGLQIIKSLIAPALDSLKRTALGKTAGAIPGIGNAVNAVTELVVGSAVLIRNCFGVTAIIVLLLAGAAPALQLLMTGLIYRLMAAFSEPVTDKRAAGALATVGKGYGMLLRLLLTVEVLFLLTIAILAGTFS